MRASFFCHFHRKLAVYVLVFQLISGDSVSLPFYFFVILVFLWVRALCRFSRFRATRTTLRPPVRKTSLTQWLRSWVSCGIGWINTFLECSGLSAWEAGPFRFVGELGEPGGGGKGLAAVRQITSNIFEFFFCFFPWFMHFVHLVHASCELESWKNHSLGKICWMANQTPPSCAGAKVNLLIFQSWCPTAQLCNRRVFP